MDAIFERLALLYFGLVGLVALLPPGRARARGAAGLCLVGLASAAAAVAGENAPGGFITINELLAAAGLVLVALGVVTWRRGWSSGTTQAYDASDDSRPSFGTSALGLASALLIPELAIRSLPAESLSLETERMLTAVTGVLAFLLAGLPPFHRVPWGRALAPLSAMLLARFVAPGLPHGLVTWQVPAMLVFTVAVVWSAWRSHWSAVAIAGGLGALWSGTVGPAPLVLVGWGWLVETGVGVFSKRGVRLGPRWTGIAAIPAGIAALPALQAALRAEVLLSAGAVAGILVGLLRDGKDGSQALGGGIY